MVSYGRDAKGRLLYDTGCKLHGCPIVMRELPANGPFPVKWRAYKIFRRYIQHSGGPHREITLDWWHHLEADTPEKLRELVVRRAHELMWQQLPARKKKKLPPVRK